jgi:hypothetical protein
MIIIIKNTKNKILFISSSDTFFLYREECIEREERNKVKGKRRKKTKNIELRWTIWRHIMGSGHEIYNFLI